MRGDQGVLCFVLLAVAAAAAPQRIPSPSLRVTPSESQPPTMGAPGALSFLEHNKSAMSGSMMIIMVILACCCLPPLMTLCCCAQFIFGAKAAIDDMKHAKAKSMREKFDKKCPAADQDKYNYHTTTGAAFKTKCDEMFAEADKDHSNFLELEELKTIVYKKYGFDDNIKKGGNSIMYPGLKAEVFMEAFDKDGSGSISKDEFFEMMKYLEWQKDVAAK